MSTTSRRPLGDSAALNMGMVRDRHDIQVGAGKMGERVVGRGGNEEEVEHLRKQLQLAKEKLSRRDDKIRDLQSGQLNPSADIERKLQELIKRHDSSKAKHEAELCELRSTNSSLQSALTALRASSLSTADLKTAHALAEADNSRLKRELEHVSRDTAKADQEKRKRKDTESKIERLRDELAQIKRSHEMQAADEILRHEADVHRLDEKVDGLEDLLEASAAAYRRAWGHRVEKREFERLWEKYHLERRRRVEAEGKGKVLEREVRDLSEECAEWIERIEVERQEREGLEEELRVLRDEREADRQTGTVMSRHHGQEERLEDIDVPHLRGLLDLSLDHAAILDTHLSSLFASHTALLTENADLQSTSSTAQVSLKSLQKEHTSLRLRYAELDAAHTGCDAEKAQLAMLSEGLEKEVRSAKEEVEEWKDEVRRLEARGVQEREGLKRVNEVVQRGKVAEGALEEEVQRLAGALEDYKAYKERYSDLEEQLRIARSREAMALEEGQRLVAENAELLRGGGELQGKVGYVEGVRREMAVVKHELAATREMLNTANERMRMLESEVEAYKSVDLLDGSAGGGRMRVSRSRRQPEGGEVIRGSVRGSQGR